MPDSLNFGRLLIDMVDSYGFYTGFVVNTAHLLIRHAISKWNVLGFGFTGSGEYNNPDPHMTSIQYMTTEHCSIHLCGWSPDGFRSIDGPFYAIVQAWDIEDTQYSGQWNSTLVHIFDLWNHLHGHINFMRVKGEIGEQSGLIVVGGSNVGLGDLTTSGGLDLARSSGNSDRVASDSLEEIPGLLKRFPELRDARPDPPSIPPLTGPEYQKRSEIQAQISAE